MTIFTENDLISMNFKPIAYRVKKITTTTAKVVFMTFLVASAGCDYTRYNVILAVDSKEYRAAMTWDEIRESGFKKPYTMVVLDNNGLPVPLFRYNHDDGSIMPMETAEIHFSTPIITNKKFDAIFVSVLDHGKEVKKVRVVIRDLQSTKGDPKSYVTPVTVP